MRRYIVERCYPHSLDSPADATAAKLRLAIVEHTAEHGVIWLHSYVSEDKMKTFCVYDGAKPRGDPQSGPWQRPAGRSITQVSVLDPYFHHYAGRS